MTLLDTPEGIARFILQDPVLRRFADQLRTEGDNAADAWVRNVDRVCDYCEALQQDRPELGTLWSRLVAFYDGVYCARDRYGAPHGGAMTLGAEYYATPARFQLPDDNQPDD